MDSRIDTVSFLDFKNLRNADFHVGSFSLLLGTNASGKSNVRDGFRFLHGISRGYTLAEIIGEKWIEGGIPVWRGIRGGTREISYQGSAGFSFLFSVHTPHGEFGYLLDVGIPSTTSGKGPPFVVKESLVDFVKVVESGDADLSKSRSWVFKTPDSSIAATNGSITAQVRTEDRRGRYPHLSFSNSRPLLSQVADSPKVPDKVRRIARSVLDALASMRFLDLQPDAMRRPSIPGQTVLGDQGENLSSVLLAMCEDPDRKKALIEWIRELTPMDVVDFDFPADQTGRVLVSLVESGGRQTSAYSASDGTLRFLGIIAALLGPEPARFYFLEELENGIHPSRLHLLLQLIEQTVEKESIQVVATTHSPQLLGQASRKTLEHSSLIYRLSDSTEAKIKPLLEIPEIRRVIETQDIADLHATGWFENVVAFTAEEKTDHPAS